MALIKFASDSKVKLLDKTIFSTSGGGGGGPTLTDTIVYDSSGNILYTYTGDVPNGWKNGDNIAGYVDIGTSATSIGNYAFQINQLTSVTIPNTVTSIGEYAFNINQLTSVTIPDSVTSIGNYAFNGNNLSGTLDIPESVTSIGVGAFSNSPNLLGVNCYALTTGFAGDAFAGTGTSSIGFGYYMSVHARAADSNLTAGDGVDFLGAQATIIKDIVTAADTAIYDTNGVLLDAVFGDVPELWKNAQGIAGYVDIGTSATSIGSGSFVANFLTSVTIPNTVTNIGGNSLSTNPFSSITIPDSVSSIGSYAFYFCQNLSNVNCYTTQSAFVGSGAFYFTASPLTIHARATDGTWTAETGIEFQGNNNVTIIKDL